jgi:hypothetical protein
MNKPSKPTIAPLLESLNEIEVAYPAISFVCVIQVLPPFVVVRIFVLS